MRGATAIGRRSAWAVVAAAAIVSSSGNVRADEIARGVVVRVEHNEVYVNFGVERGAVAGTPIRFKRTLRLNHPVTRKVVVDWLPLGSGTVSHSGKKLSMTRVPKTVAAEVRPGDVAELYLDKPAESKPAPVPEPAAPADGAQPPEPGLDPDMAAVLATWQDMTGASLDRRIATWERFVAGNPSNVFTDNIRSDIAELRRLRDSTHTPDDSIDSPHLEGIAHASPSIADDGSDLALAFVIDDPAELSSAWLHYRRRGDASYKRTLLRRESELYLRGTVPAQSVQAPGVEYFVEIARTDGQLGTAVGRPDRPIRVEVETPSIAEAFANDGRGSRVSIRGSYQDFANLDDRSGDHTDRFFVFETDIAYRVAGWLHQIHAGFGSVHGSGGFANQSYTDEAPAPSVGFNYGYAGVVLHAPHSPIGFAARAISGVGQEGLGFGVEGRVRLGYPYGTNISFGGSRIAELGFLSDMRLEIPRWQRAPLGFTVAVTDQPNEGDLGVVFAGDMGWRALDWLVPTLRLSYQGRTVAHSGVGLGLGLVFGW